MEQYRNLYESVARLQSSLQTAGFESIVIGGLALMVWGEPRLTRDADLKVLAGREQARQLLDALPQDYQPQSPTPEETLKQIGFIFTQDANGVRVDLLLADLGFDAIAIRRGRQVKILNQITITVCTPEDLIIYKLISTRARDHEDAANVVRRQGNKLDHDYVEDWLRQFEIALDDSTLVEPYLKLKLAHS